MTEEDDDSRPERRSGVPTRSGIDRRKADRRIADVPVEVDRRKGPTRSGQDRRVRDRRQS